jgi:hypothetical protein
MPVGGAVPEYVRGSPLMHFTGHGDTGHVTVLTAL